MAGKLAVVPPGAKVQRAKPLTITQALSESERDVLAATRLKIAREIDAGPPPAYLAPLSRQLLEIDRQIRALDAREEQEAASGGEVPDEAFDSSAL